MTSKYIGRSQAVVANQAYSKAESDAKYLPATNESLFLGTSFGQTAAGYADDLVISKDIGNNVGMTILSDSSRVGSVFFGDESDPDVGGLRYYHSDDELRMIAGGAEAARVSSVSGISLDNGSNYLSSYEKGTFEIKLNVGGIDKQANNCRYVKIGNLVFIEMIGDNSNNPFFSDSPAGAAGAEVRISTATGFGQLPFVPKTTGNGIMSFTRGVRSSNGVDAQGHMFAWGWLKDNVQLYVGRVSKDGNEYNIWDGNVSGDTNVTIEKDSSVSNVVLSAQFCYYTDD